MEHTQNKLESGVPAKDNRRAFRAGSYSVLATVLVLLLAAVVVLGVEKLPTTLTKLDTTATKLLTLTDQSKQIARGLTQDVEIYLISNPEKIDPIVEELLNRYAAESRRIHVTHIDPVISPNFFAQYSDGAYYDNSLVFVSNERSECVNYYDLYDSALTSDLAESSFNGEELVTNAIDFVTSDTLPIVYRLTGHGEAYPPGALQDGVKGDNIELSELNLLSLSAVPAEGKAVLIYSPKTDLSAQEADCLIDYLAQGGKLLLVTDYSEAPMPNLMRVVARYGLSLAGGIVMESDENYSLRGYPYYLLPQVNSHTLTTPLRIGGYRVLMPLAQGIVQSGVISDNVAITSLLDTSDHAYVKASGYNISTFDKEPGDLTGDFSVGIAVTEAISADVAAQLVWFTTSEMFHDEPNKLVSNANRELFLNSLAWLCKRENTIALRSKSTLPTQLTVPTAAASRWSLIMILGIPLLVIAVGVVVLVLRKRK